jgi:GNAT superfamily N-acetyltransferase
VPSVSPWFNYPMIIRQATPQDIPVLTRLRWDFRTEHHAPPPGSPTWAEFQPVCAAFFERAMHTDRWAFFVAEQDGQIIAQVCLERIEKIPNPRALHPEFGYITNVYTRPPYRNTGLGAQLMAHVQAWAKEQGLEMLLLWPSPRAVPFYQRLGFDFSEKAMEWEEE